MTTTALEHELKQMIIETLELEDVTPDDIDPEEPLFVEGLGLDSIDALELGLALQKRYGITLESEAESSRQHFANLKSLAALVESRRQK
ncbi:acyl carrier protein [Salinicola corii]|uniref:Acyl carrier protein n=1 Tax=Salinicola corii TaxID=2606937 RepID=A0A640WC69_9GAMM|nr:MULTISPECIES: phosphopantetheine-binding protein [Salinicola]KAA0016455.1 acyl carrier protein [Salinicola corii]MAM59198.1 acyl carrier protein [Salinicola sp.]NRB56098.1 acyl carrier protein [Salinicola sp.]